MRKGAGKKLIFLSAVLLALVVFACVSVSKFVLTDKKELVGAYTDFVLSHDGAGQTAVLRQTGTTATGYIAVTVSNFADEKVSRRNVRFMMRPPVSGVSGDCSCKFLFSCSMMKDPPFRKKRKDKISIHDFFQ